VGCVPSKTLIRAAEAHHRAGGKVLLVQGRDPVDIDGVVGVQEGDPHVS